VGIDDGHVGTVDVAEVVGEHLPVAKDVLEGEGPDVPGGGVAHRGQLGLEEGGGVGPLLAHTGRLLPGHQCLDVAGGGAVTGDEGHHRGVGEQEAAVGEGNEIHRAGARLVAHGDGVDHVFVVVVFLV